MVSSSAGEGPGAVISRGLTERRVFNSSMASGTNGFFRSKKRLSPADKQALPRAKATLDQL
jgi:hypothetical protein